MPYADIEMQRAAQRRYYDLNKDKVKKTARDRRSLVVKFVQEYKQSRGCMDCKIMYPYWILEFDHVRDEKVGNVGAMVKTHSLEAVKLELEKCDVVCSNCHRDRTRNRAIVSGEAAWFVE